jgi:glycosyltransferase involved in cell wall biosynthesis
VIIPHFEQPSLLERCLESLEAQHGAPPFEIIVVDNGSSRLPTEICARFRLVRLLLETAKGPGPARNRGAAAAQAPALLFIDADCVADPDWIANADCRMRDSGDHIIFGGDVRILPADPARMSAIEAYEELFAYRADWMIRRYHFVVTCNLAVSKSKFEEIGPFIPGLLISEDMEWGRRAHGMGQTIAYVPEMRIATPARETFSEVARRWDRQVGQQHAELKGLPMGRLRWLLKTLAMPISPFAELPRILVSSRLRRPGERWGAFLVLIRTRLWRSWRMIQLIVGAVGDEWLTGAWRRPPTVPSSFENGGKRVPL